MEKTAARMKPIGKVQSQYRVAMTSQPPCGLHGRFIANLDGHFINMNIRCGQLHIRRNAYLAFHRILHRGGNIYPFLFLVDLISLLNDAYRRCTELHGSFSINPEFLTPLFTEGGRIDAGEKGNAGHVTTSWNKTIQGLTQFVKYDKDNA